MKRLAGRPRRKASRDPTGKRYVDFGMYGCIGAVCRRVRRVPERVVVLLLQVRRGTALLTAVSPTRWGETALSGDPRDFTSRHPHGGDIGLQ